MSPLDITLAILLLIGIVRGFLRGFIFEIAMLGTLCLCYFLGFKLAAMCAVWIGKIIHVNPSTLHYIAMFTAWIGISIGVYFIAKLLEGLVNVVALGPLNKIAGAIFGGMKYAFLISLFLYFFNKINISTSWLNADAKANSMLYYPLLKISAFVMS